MTESTGTAVDPQPEVRRRREVGHGSARSLLMTLLGEFVLPRKQPVWTGVLVDAMKMFGIEEKSARQALARTGNEAWLESEKIGRRVRWSLTSPGTKLLTEGGERIYSFGAEKRAWDGKWLILLVSVPESKRDLRHPLRTKLTWAGFASPAPSVWICPHPAQEAEALDILRELDLQDAMSFIGGYGAVGDETSLVQDSWGLGDLRVRYEDFVAAFSDVEPSDGGEALQAQARLVHEWRRFPFLDPQLPEALLPANWSGTKAAELFHRRHSEWNEPAQAYWDKLIANNA